ncbi:MAG: hypothetical protein GX805_02790 [Gammaproteobacteria bacterium]|nr:hypothetical protein [Gammaproteobacteria bacterium]
MNTLLRCCILCATALLLAACASHGTMRHQPAAATDADGLQQDVRYMQAVEYVARRRGVEVRWVNPPLKRMVASADSGPD